MRPSDRPHQPGVSPHLSPNETEPGTRSRFALAGRFHCLLSFVYSRKLTVMYPSNVIKEHILSVLGFYSASVTVSIRHKQPKKPQKPSSSLVQASVSLAVSIAQRRTSKRNKVKSGRNGKFIETQAGHKQHSSLLYSMLKFININIPTFFGPFVVVYCSEWNPLGEKQTLICCGEGRPMCDGSL